MTTTCLRTPKTTRTEDNTPEPGSVAWFWRNFRNADSCAANCPTADRLAGARAAWCDAWSIMRWNGSLIEVRGDLSTLTECRTRPSIHPSSKETPAFRAGYVEAGQEILEAINGLN